MLSLRELMLSTPRKGNRALAIWLEPGPDRVFQHQLVILKIDQLLRLALECNHDIGDIEGLIGKHVAVGDVEMQDQLSADVLDPDRAMRDDMGLDDLLGIDFPGLRLHLPVPDKLLPHRAQDIVFQLQIAQIAHEREQKAERHEKNRYPE